LVFNFALKYNIVKVKANQEGLKLNGKHQILIYGNEVNIIYGSIYTIKGKTEALLVASKQIGLEVNADKTKCIVLSRIQRAGRSHNISVGNKSFERVGHFRYLGTILTNQNFIRETIDIRLESGNDYYRWL